MRGAAAVAAVVPMLLAPAAASRTLRVPSAYATIQSAVAAATSGDTILVAPGAYAGPVVLDTKGNVRLLSEAGRGETTIEGALELVNSGKLLVKGFAIHGRVRIACNNGTVFSQCAVSGSTESGIVIAGCPGGAYSDVEISSCLVESNARHGVEGELSGGKARIAESEIRANGLSGVSILHSYVEVARNVIHDNGANGVAEEAGTASIHSNTIARNALAGIHIATGGNPYTQTIERNVVALNGTAGIFGDAGGIYAVTCGDVWGNGAGGAENYAGAIPDGTGTAGNISADPIFCGAASGVFSLAAESPALAQACGAMGAAEMPGCAEPDAARAATWGEIKALFR